MILPGTGKTHPAIALSIRACLKGHRVQFRTVTEWVALLGEAKRRGSLDDELRKIERVPLIVVDEVGYTPLRSRRRQPDVHRFSSLSLQEDA